MAQPLALVAQRLLAAGLEALGRLDERAQLVQPRLLGRRVARQLVVPPARRRQLAPGEPRVAPAPQLLLAEERVEDVELVRRPGEPALLELAGHRDQALRGGREILARDRPAPGVRARPPVREHAAREHETRLVLGRELRQRGELLVVEEAVGQVELGLDVRLGPRGADDARVALRTEQQPDRLGQDRLAGTRLAGDRGQARRGRELAVADEHEVLDPEATKQRSGCSG